VTDIRRPPARAEVRTVDFMLDMVMSGVGCEVYERRDARNFHVLFCSLGLVRTDVDTSTLP